MLWCFCSLSWSAFVRASEHASKQMSERKRFDGCLRSTKTSLKLIHEMDRKYWRGCAWEYEPLVWEWTENDENTGNSLMWFFLSFFLPHSYLLISWINLTCVMVIHASIVAIHFFLFFSSSDIISSLILQRAVYTSGFACGHPSSKLCNNTNRLCHWTEGALIISVHLSTEITTLSLMLPIPSIHSVAQLWKQHSFEAHT